MADGVAGPACANAAPLDMATDMIARVRAITIAMTSRDSASRSGLRRGPDLFASVMVRLACTLV